MKSYWTNISKKPKNLKMIDKYNRIYSYTISVLNKNKFIEYITIENKLDDDYDIFYKFMRIHYNLKPSEFSYDTMLFNRDRNVYSCILSISVYNIKKYFQNKRTLKLKKLLNA